MMTRFGVGSNQDQPQGLQRQRRRNKSRSRCFLSTPWISTIAVSLLLLLVRDKDADIFVSVVGALALSSSSSSSSTTTPYSSRSTQNWRKDQNHQQQLKPTGKNNNNNNNNKKNLPESELLNRRKSPALWREDLAFVPQDSDTIDATMNDVVQPVRSEVMAPAGGWPQLQAAVANGADAVYVGLTAFSARARATNFDPVKDLPTAVQFCHQAGVKLYVALNTLAFDTELEEVSQIIQLAAHAGVDALIVQDLGVAKLAQRHVQAMEEEAPRKRGPQGRRKMEIHASTQQTVTSADGVAFCQEHDATRVVLGRELSVTEMAQVAAAAATAAKNPNNPQKPPVEVEAFVHGALCVSYSGQCFSSEAWGGRSANRGQCAQACRLPYGLIRDGELVDLQDMQYLLSPRDLCGLEQVPALMRAGVACLKIEGRLKDAAYVAATTRAYRRAVDRAWKEMTGQGPARILGGAAIVAEDQRKNTFKQEEKTNGVVDSSNAKKDEEVTWDDLTLLFSRGQDANHPGLTSGFLEGTRHQEVVRGRSPRHRGMHVGHVSPESSPQRGLVIQLNDNGGDHGSDSNNHHQREYIGLKRGDGIVVDRGRAQEEELGGPIYDVQVLAGKKVLVVFGRDVMKRWKKADQQKQLNAGGKNAMDMMAPALAHVWKTSDATVDKKVRRWIQAPIPRPSVRVRVSGSVGQRLTVTLSWASASSAVLANRQSYGHDVATAGTSEEASGSSLEVMELARDKSGSWKPDQVRKAVGTLGNTPWTLQGGIEAIDLTQLDENAFFPMSWVKEARRQAVQAFLDLQRDAPDTDGASKDNDTIMDSTMQKGAARMLLEEVKERHTARLTSVAQLPTVHPALDKKPTQRMKLSVLARNQEQVEALCHMIEEDDLLGGNQEENRIDEIIVDFLEVDGMREAVERVRLTAANLSNKENTPRVVVASPRILKPGEAGIWRTLLRLRPDALLVRSHGLLHRMNTLGGTGAKVHLKSMHRDDIDSGIIRGSENDAEEVVTIPRLYGDFSLNAANAITALELLNAGLDRITASYDLNSNAILEMAELMSHDAAEHLEVIAHSKMPIFHTEHCVFARFLSNGNSYLDCGHVCTRHTVHLRDTTGADNLVLADMGCRNTVFSSQAQSGIYSLNDWRDVGVGGLRLEFVDEGPGDVTRVVQGYLDVLNGNKKPRHVWDELATAKDSNGRAGGVTLGSFNNKVERRAGEL